MWKPSLNCCHTSLALPCRPATAGMGNSPERSAGVGFEIVKWILKTVKIFLDQRPKPNFRSMKKIGFLIDPPERLDGRKDSSVELMRAAEVAGNEVVIFTVGQMRMDNSTLHIAGAQVRMAADGNPWHTGERNWSGNCRKLDLIMLRLEPPIDDRFRHACAMLEIARRQGTPVINDPQAVLIGEEKISALLYPQFAPQTLVASRAAELIEFADQLPDGCVIKKLGGMGGQGVFAFAAGDSNIPAAISHVIGHSGFGAAAAA